jgi:hypothetical protein
MTTQPDLAELRRRLDALPGFALRHLHGGPGVEPYIALADEGGMPLSESGFDAVLLFAETAALEVPRLLDRLAHGQQHAGHPAGGTWCGVTNDPGVADVRPRVPVCADCHIKAMRHRADLLDAADERDALAAFAQGLQVATDSLRAERDALAAKVKRVRALHAIAYCGDSTCEHCPCSTCPPRLGWPCPTIRALDEEPQP